MTTTISDLSIHLGQLGIPVAHGELYGIELEIEAPGLYEGEEYFDEDSEEYIAVDVDIPLGWRKEVEESIQGAELVFASPQTLEAGEKLIRKLFQDIVIKQGHRPTRSPRGSTHVHVNVGDLSYDQLKNFIVACAWAEPFLIELAGKGRKGNLFTLPFSVAPLGWSDAIESVREKTPCFYNDTHYMAINFRQIIKYGSVEFRMGPSMRDADEAIQWLNLIAVVAKAGRNEEIGVREHPDFVDYLLALIPEGRRQALYLSAFDQADVIYRKVHRARRTKLSNQLPIGNLENLILESFPVSNLSVADFEVNVTSVDVI